MSLKRRILVLFLALMLAGMWGLATRLAYVLESELKQSLATEMSATVDYVARNLDSQLALRTDVLKSVAQTITPEMLKSAEMLRRHLGGQITSHDLFPVGFQVLDVRGVVVGQYPIKQGRLGYSRANRDYFKEAMASGEATIGTPTRGALSDVPLLTFVVPIRNASGAVVGLLIGGTPLSDNRLFGDLEDTKIGGSGYFVVVSRKANRIVSATDKRRILGPLPARGLNPLFDRRMNEGYEAAGVTVNSMGDEVFTVAHNMKTTDWFVLAGLKTDEAFSPIVTLKVQLYGFTCLLSLLIALVLYVVLTRQLSVLDEASAAIKRMTGDDGRLAPLPVRSNDEIGILVSSFNELVIRRQALDDELRQQRDLYETLLKAQSDVGQGVCLIEGQRIVFANEALCRLSGYTSNEMREMPSFAVLIHPVDRERVLDSQRQRLHWDDLSLHEEISILTRDGARLDVEMARAVVRTGPSELTVVVMADITERRRMQLALQRANETLEGRVAERTAALKEANRTLQDEVSERRRLEHQIIDISEEAQRRVGQELHDGVGQLLTGIAFVCKGMEKGLTARAQPEATAAAKVVQLVAEAVEQTRRIARGLYPVDVEAGGLASALNMLARRTCEVYGVNCVFHGDAAMSVDDHMVAINFFRIAQEAVTNAIKHGKAANIAIGLDAENGRLRLSVTDDGAGVDAAAASQHRGMGLQIMRYRANMISASLDIRPAAGGGSEITVQQLESDALPS